MKIEKIYQILDGYSNPYEVVVTHNENDEISKVCVYRTYIEEIRNVYYRSWLDHMFTIYKPSKIFVGNTDDTEGASILIKLFDDELTYIHVGDSVYEFEAPEEIDVYIARRMEGTVRFYAYAFSNDHMISFQDRKLLCKFGISHDIQIAYIDGLEHIYSDILLYNNGNPRIGFNPVSITSLSSIFEIHPIWGYNRQRFTDRKFSG